MTSKMLDEIQILVFHPQNVQPAALINRLLAMGFWRVATVSHDQVFSPRVVELLEETKARWIWLLESTDEVTDSCVATLQQAFEASCENMEPGGTSCLVNLPVNSTFKIEDGYRLTSKMFESTMTYSTVPPAISNGIFDRLAIKDLWRWASTNDPLTYRFGPETARAAFFLLIWLNLYTRIGFAYGVFTPFVISKSEPVAIEIYDEVRTYYINKWIGISLLP